MYELDNRKDQVMTICKVAMANLAMWVRTCVNASIRRFPAYPMGDSSPLPCDQLVAFFLRRGEPKYRETLVNTRRTLMRSVGIPPLPKWSRRPQ